MPKKLKFKPMITRVKLNPEQAVLACNCWQQDKYMISRPFIPGGDPNWNIAMSGIGVGEIICSSAGTRAGGNVTLLGPPPTSSECKMGVGGASNS